MLANNQLSQLKVLFGRSTRETGLTGRSPVPNVPASNSTLEKEARFGHYNKGHFVSSVPFTHYHRLQEHLQKLFPFPKQVMSRVDSYRGDYRVIVTGDSKVYQLKKSDSRNHVEDFSHGIRYATSLETTVSSSDIKTHFSGLPTNSRERTRISYPLSGPESLQTGVLSGNRTLMALELTDILSGTESFASTHEVEIEFYGTKEEEVLVFLATVEKIYLILRGSNLLYTIADTIYLNDSLRFRFINSEKPYIDSQMLVRPRNIQERDLLYGGIVGNQKLSWLGKETPGTAYSVSVKADGVRKMVIFFQNKLWCIYPPDEYNLLAVFSSQEIADNPSLSKVFGKTTIKSAAQNSFVEGTIFDGEEITGFAENSYYLLLLDTLLYRGTDARNSQFPKRRSCLENFNLQLSRIRIAPKPTFLVDTPDAFFSSVNRLLYHTKLDYAIDGLIFTPVNCVYNPGTEVLPLKQRTALSVPDVLKWKDPSKITIDFIVKRTGKDGKISLLVYQPEPRKKGHNVKFTSNDPPFDPETMIGDNHLTRGKDGVVVEYAWDPLLQQLIPVRVRAQKKTANKLDTARNNWRDLNNPLTEGDICGRTLRLAFNYHRRIRAQLYSFLPSDVNILDIGSGKGADVGKWVKLAEPSVPRKGFVVAVEPDAKNRQELVRRIEGSKLSAKVKVLDAQGEDTLTITEAVEKFIPGGKVDAVVLMLSLSFFWRNRDNLDRLVTTIVNNLRVNGQIIFFTIDGSRVLELMEPSFLPEKKVQEIELATNRWILHPPSTDKNSGRVLDISLPDTIVGNQREYLVFLNDFNTRLRRHGIVPGNLYHADKELLLGKDALIYTSLYSYGIYTRRQEEFSVLPSSFTFNNQLANLFETPTVEVLLGQEKRPYSNILPNYTPLTKTFEIISDDQVLPVNCTWQRYLLRIGIIDDSSSLLHAVLKGFYPAYQEAKSTVSAYYPLENVVASNDELALFLQEKREKEESKRLRKEGLRQSRREMVTSARLLLAKHLWSINDSDGVSRYAWNYINNGCFPLLTLSQIFLPSLLLEREVDFSIYGLVNLLNSTAPLRDETYDIISSAFSVDLFVLSPIDNERIIDDLTLYATTASIEAPRMAIVLLRFPADSLAIEGRDSNEHYELLALASEQGPQTLFSRDHPFIRQIMTIFSDPQKLPQTCSPKISAPLVNRNIDLDERFVEGTVQICREWGITHSEWQKWRDEIYRIFNYSTAEALLFSYRDPMVEIVARNYQRIYEKLD